MSHTMKIHMRLVVMKMSIRTSKVKASNPLRLRSLPFYTNIAKPGKFIPTRRTPGVSTSELLERIVSGYRRRDFDEKLAKMGHAELRAEGSDYDAHSSRSMSPAQHG
jgi:hypothetical protein